MHIRYAVKKDAKTIAAIQVKAWRYGYKGIMSDEYLNSISVKERTIQWDQILEQTGPGINLVIELNSSISGFCVYGPARDHDLSDENAGELVALNILPHVWGKGLGTALIKYVMESAHSHNWHSIYLWVLKDNTRARGLYDHMGFTVEGSEKFDTTLTDQELHEIRYAKALS